jgi:hypothetical protein
VGTTSVHGGAPDAAAHPGEPPEAVAEFLRLSVILTGFEEFELLGTGMLMPYYDELLRIIGAREAGALLGALSGVALSGVAPSGVAAGDDGEFRRVILDSPRYGPVARNVAMMWYLGTWTQLPRPWRNTFGATACDTDHVVSAAAYREGLVWPAAGTHPMSAKQPGFGSWARPPFPPGAGAGA